MSYTTRYKLRNDIKLKKNDKYILARYTMKSSQKLAIVTKPADWRFPPFISLLKRLKKNIAASERKKKRERSIKTS